MLESDFLPERVNELTTASAKVFLVGNFVMFALLWVMVLLFGDILTKCSLSDEFVITFYCTELKVHSGKMNPFNKIISATFTEEKSH